MPSVRAGAGKTVSETSGLTVDLDPQRSAEHWTPVLIDTPGFHDLPEATPGDSLPPVPLPGLMFPTAG
ncbi:hypothetical protein ACFCY8_11365 [Streptomyces noursei]|uniref:hypothetical protein n=1 Tax=Streptomyces noursei TaxID=1971 RepID=UPI0035D7738A